MTIKETLDEARARIAVTDGELAEARRRRQLVADALMAEFGGRVYFNGSLAHRDANDPLTDFDIGVVVPNPDGEYGLGAKSAAELKERARDAVRAALAEEFPDLRVEVEGRKRSVLVRFFDPVSDRAVDFTGDIIIALDHPEGGLWIPLYDIWDRSDPEKHTELIADGISNTGGVLAHANRLLKHWSARHDLPMCSWHIKVCSLHEITKPMPLVDALVAFFGGTYDALGDGDTPDPAGIGPDIKPRVSRTHARQRLQAALDDVRAAKDAEADGRPLLAEAKLANVLPDIIDRPTDQELADEERRHQIARLRRAGNRVGVGAGSTVKVANTRGWRLG
jgi:hypothetical protein